MTRKQALRAAGLACFAIATVAGVYLSWLAPRNGGVLVALVLVMVGIALIKMAEAY